MILKIEQKIMSLALLMILALLFNGTASAVDFISEKNVHISNIHTIEDDLFASGSNITIDGEVRGDLFAAGEKIITNGVVENSANIACNSYSQSGEINGALRAVAFETVDIDGNIGRSAIIASNDCKIGKNSVVEKELHFFGKKINLDGSVLGNVNLQCESVYLTGTIDGNVKIKAKNIYINPPALIKGDLKYTSVTEANIDTKAGVTILGKTTWDLPDKDAQNDSDAFLSNSVKTISKFLAALLFGIIIMMIGRRYLTEMVHQLQNRFAVSAATGVVSIVVVAISIVILVGSLILMIVGITLISEGSSVGGMITLALATLLVPISSFLTVSGGVIMYSGKIIIAILLGYLIMKKIQKSPSYLNKTQLLVGLIVLYLLFSIPYFGVLLMIVVSVVGAGAIVLGFKHCNMGMEKFESSKSVGK